MGTHQPYLYSAVDRNDARFPEPKFDPKAVTRASWEPQPRKPKREGPLVSFNLHPDTHTYRNNDPITMNPRTKMAVKILRPLQQGLRVLEMIGAAGVLVLMILITKIDTISGWVMRITPGVVIVHCAYSIYHLSRDPAGRAPGSSAAFQLFSGVSDLCILPLYAYGVLATYQRGDTWETLLSDQSLMDYFVPTVRYTLIGAGGLHAISLFISAWLGWIFRRISHMPPDMNPLEDNLTARPQHRRNKLSTASTVTDSDKHLGSPISMRRGSDFPYDEITSPPSIPFKHTRSQSDTSAGSRGSQCNFPPRQYQITPGNSPRHSRPEWDASPGSPISPIAARPAMARSSLRDSQSEISMREFGPIRPEAVTIAVEKESPRRAPKFTETWAPTDSLISRTNQRNREIAASKASAANNKRASQPYEAVNQRYNLDDISDCEGENENYVTYDTEDDDDHPGPFQPDPLRLSSTKTRSSTYSANDNSLSELNPNARQVSHSRDIADTKTSKSPWKQNRDSSIQLDMDFYTRPYGELKPAMPPIMVGSDRKVSSGNDFADLHNNSGAHGRRNVSGKIAEEGLAGKRSSRYSMLD